ncbi:MAG: YaeQ family protein [Alphaproteobacteria bacterium]|nr:YaeQ family protein [Alphaproteobacteria bacterium]
MLDLRGKLRLTLDIDCGPMGTSAEGARLTLFKKRGESYRHVVLKLISYGLFYHPELQVEVSAEQHHKPDLVRFNARNEPVQWVECGTTRRRKLDRISSRNRLTFIDIVKPSGGEMRQYALSCAGHLRHPERVRYFGFRPDFVPELTDRLYDHAHLILSVPGEAWTDLHVDLDGERISTPIEREGPG